VVHGLIQVANAHQTANPLKEQGGDLGPFIHQYRVRGPVYGYPVPEKRGGDVRCRYAGQGAGWDQLREPVDNDQEEGVPGLGLS